MYQFCITSPTEHAKVKIVASIQSFVRMTPGANIKNVINWNLSNVATSSERKKNRKLSTRVIASNINNLLVHGIIGMENKYAERYYWIKLVAG